MTDSAAVLIVDGNDVIYLVTDHGGPRLPWSVARVLAAGPSTVGPVLAAQVFAGMVADGRDDPTGYRITSEPVDVRRPRLVLFPSGETVGIESGPVIPWAVFVARVAQVAAPLELGASWRAFERPP